MAISSATAQLCVNQALQDRTYTVSTWFLNPSVGASVGTAMAQALSGFLSPAQILGVVLAHANAAAKPVQPGAVSVSDAGVQSLLGLAGKLAASNAAVAASANSPAFDLVANLVTNLV
jgi:hypothetical protein